MDMKTDTKSRRPESRTRADGQAPRQTRISGGQLLTEAEEKRYRDGSCEARHPAASPPGPTTELSVRSAARGQERLAAGLAMTAGFVDAYGMITYNTYLSFMSGNTTQTGYRNGQGDFAEAVPSALAIVFFVGGSFAGTLLAHSELRRTRQLVFGLVGASLALIIGFAQLNFLSCRIHIAVVSFAMGAMNTALSRVGSQSVSLTFVTGTLSRLGMHLALAVKRAPLLESQGLVLTCTALASWPASGVGS